MKAQIYIKIDKEISTGLDWIGVYWYGNVANAWTNNDFSDSKH